MELLYWESEHLNFGDDLNLWLWDALLPGYREKREGEKLLGVGTILTAEMAAEEVPTHVLGSGVGYGRCPDVKAMPHLNIHCLRGPLSARAMGVVPEKGIIDPAALLPELEQFKIIEPSQEIAFVPHWHSAMYGQWDKVCQQTGMKYVNPCAEAVSVIKAIASSKLVVAESMHGAIVADAFRVPWVPVTSSKMVLAFKWLDWASSLEMPYRPVSVPLSSAAEKIYKKELTSRSGQVTSYDVEETFQQWAALQQGLAKQDGGAKQASFLGKVKKHMLHYSQENKGKFPVSLVDTALIDQAAKALQHAATTTSYLSEDAVYERRKAELHACYDQFQKTYLS